MAEKRRYRKLRTAFGNARQERASGVALVIRRKIRAKDEDAELLPPSALPPTPFDILSHRTVIRCPFSGALLVG